AIIEAYKQDKITKETAIMYASDARYVASKMRFYLISIFMIFSKMSIVLLSYVNSQFDCFFYFIFWLIKKEENSWKLRFFYF
ncbi:hypothetical protein NE569_15265, partial [Longicatena caecimuris]|uniref:hypothetical protein n=1 Tax=Longicatena caecimuris TaxID=1796635 RepID=UPI0021092DA6